VTCPLNDVVGPIPTPNAAPWEIYKHAMRHRSHVITEFVTGNTLCIGSGCRQLLYEYVIALFVNTHNPLPMANR
jgi:hypothetical protein